MLQQAPTLGIDEIVMGMAHRGRLTVLATIFGKSSEFIFKEFSENYIPDAIYGDGDVKYHLGYDSTVKSLKGEAVRLTLAPNPSHLESVDPVVQGYARARQRSLGDKKRKRVLPFLIHGDAALAGQGVVSEVLNLSQLPGYTTGGTVHFVINNQIGFTTAPSEARSSHYCTDVAKMIEAPIFHVNGDDPLAVAWVTQIALEFCHEFSKDVFIDMYCYRRHGHNESDEPSFTQPLLYKKIKGHPLVSTTLAQQMTAAGTVSEEEVTQIKERYHDQFHQAFERVKASHSDKKQSANPFVGSNAVSQKPYSFAPIETKVDQATLTKVAEALAKVPEDFRMNAKIKRQVLAKQKVFDQGLGIDWAYAEQLAWGTLLLDGTSVRLSGQDSIRGTFSQRHALFYDIDHPHKHYAPLASLTEDKEGFSVYNSTLSEAGVLGFEFGYSLESTDVLCIWEAQFGDFINGAQVIIDQFLTSSESKWQRVSGLVLLLPHGYEGQGPEHSSARLERFLQACAEDNIQVCNLTTPAQYFHVLRRQIKSPLRKPLIIMAPKSLLRHKSAASPVKDFTEGTFLPLMDDAFAAKKGIKRLVFCSGKVYYDLLAYRTEHKIKDTALIRIEQLYPFDDKGLEAILKGYANYKTITWCQEESKNMGGWTYIAPILEQATGSPIRYAGRDASASPAVGALARHKKEQQDLIEDAFA